MRVKARDLFYMKNGYECDSDCSDEDLYDNVSYEIDSDDYLELQTPKRTSNVIEELDYEPNLENFTKKFKNLKISNYRQLQKVADSLGLNSLEKKVTLYHRVKNYLEIQDTISKERELKIQWNSMFSQNQSLFSSSTLSNGELLFWKVFKNKTIFKEIFSNIKYKEVYGYDDMVKAEYVLKYYSNGAEIVKDKIKSNNNIISNQNDMEAILKSIRGFSEDNEIFYRNLFTKFKSHGKNSQFKNVNKWFNLIISSYNKLATSQYIKIFDLSTGDIRGNITNFQEHYNFFSSYQGIKMFSFLKTNDCIDKDSFIIKPFNQINVTSDSFKLKQLVTIFRIIVSIVQDNNGIKTEKIDRLINELQQIEFTKLDQFNSKIVDIIENPELLSKVQVKKEGNNQTLKNIIFKLFKLFYSVNKKLQLLVNKSKKFYFHKTSRELNEMLESESPSLDLNRLLKISNKGDLVKICKDYYCHYTTDFSKQSDFHKMILNSNNVVLIEALYKVVSFGIVKQHEFPYLIKSINSTEVLDYYFNNHKDSGIFKQEEGCWRFFQSVELLVHYEKLMEGNIDILQYGDTSHLKYLNIQVLLHAINSLNLGSKLYYIERELKIEDFLHTINNAITKGEQESVISLFSTFCFKSIDLSKLFEHVVMGNNELNSNYYHIKKIERSKITLILDWIFQYCPLHHIYNSIKTGNYKEVVIPIEFIQENHIGNKINSNEYNEELEQTSKYTYLDSKRLITFRANFLDFLTYLSLIGRSDDIISLYLNLNNIITNKNIHRKKSLFHFFSSNTLEKFISLFKDNLVDNCSINLLYHALYVAASKGFLPLFKQLAFDSSYMLKKRMGRNGSLFESNLLYNLVTASIDNGNSELAHFLINFINFSTKEIKSLRVLECQSKNK
ncbi:hypothetical protein DICPUDRAFT_74873 [Dictyostelium purpureum]|uniref:Uncharacterized protein n=1 Tax=Dictyostelium purpureum TaxID=5786 RepID=F0Z8Z8_DICPU|nr:uncharacterized protein DICPUDRAFT_74873 [Dictyostelium purpureum]EGC39548.1 hypothetical protein DICPUDRAFT_74873 [Dictyostelium purpureum]|eukprot:XP_003283883.1 hypothetical protein DICPUDRAFT_74873 [Dictyostelium purpureum]